VGVTARGGEALVAERLLHEVSRRAAVEGVRGVGEGLLHEVGRGTAVEGVGGVAVPKPMRRDALGGAGAPGGFFDNAPEL